MIPTQITRSHLICLTSRDICRSEGLQIDAAQKLCLVYSYAFAVFKNREMGVKYKSVRTRCMKFEENRMSRGSHIHMYVCNKNSWSKSTDFGVVAARFFILPPCVCVISAPGDKPPLLFPCTTLLAKRQ